MVGCSAFEASFFPPSVAATPRNVAKGQGADINIASPASIRLRARPLCRSAFHQGEDLFEPGRITVASLQKVLPFSESSRQQKGAQRRPTRFASRVCANERRAAERLALR